MKTLFGRVPGSDSVLRIDYNAAVQAVDELIQPPKMDECVCPGFIDLQVNGFAGVDFNNPSTSQASLLEATVALASTGVTRCFPTVITAAPEHMAAAFRNLANAKSVWRLSGLSAAEMFAGFHMEGPHISPEDGPRGAHPAAHVRPPDIDEFERMQSAAAGHIRLVTLSPEWDGAPAYIAHLVRSGVVASIGHTKATAEQIDSAVRAGATMSTHLGNGAHSILHKTGNYLWQQLACDKLAASFILDGIHLPWPFVQTAFRAKGLERCVLVTDAVMPAMCPPGRYQLGGQDVETDSHGRVVLAGTTRLAGSTLRLDQAVENAIRLANLTLREALTCVTSNAARVGRIGGRLRGLTPGEKADFVRFRWEADSHRLIVLETIVAGESTYTAESG